MLTLFFGLFTTHFGGENYNNNNHLYGISYNQYIVGHMINSHYRESYIIAYDKPYGKNWGVLYGLSTGYDYDCMTKICTASERDADGVLPIVAPYYQLGMFRTVLQGNSISISATISF